MFSMISAPPLSGARARVYASPRAIFVLTARRPMRLLYAQHMDRVGSGFFQKPSPDLCLSGKVETSRVPSYDPNAVMIVSFGWGSRFSWLR